MLRQLEAVTGWIVAQSEANLWIQLLRQANGFKSFVFNPRFGGRLIWLLNLLLSDAQRQRGRYVPKANFCPPGKCLFCKLRKICRSALKRCVLISKHLWVSKSLKKRFNLGI